MNDRSADDHSSHGETLGDRAAAQRLRAQRQRLAEPRSLLALIPRRDLTKVALLLVLLVAIVIVQRRSGSLVRRLSEVFLGPPPPVQTTPREAPRVRVAPPVNAP